jgi:hypothetical protein
LYINVRAFGENCMLLNEKSAVTAAISERRLPFWIIIPGELSSPKRISTSSPSMVIFESPNISY